MKIIRYALLVLMLANNAYAAIDPKLWDFAEPVDSKGGTKGEAITVDYKDARYPKPSVEGYYKLRAPVNGAHTSGTHQARDEAREKINGKKAAWKLTDGGTLHVVLSADEFPVLKDGKCGPIMIGQIHGANTNNERVRLYDNCGILSYKDDKAGSKHKETEFFLTDANGKRTAIPIGAKFEYLIKQDKDKVTVTAHFNGIDYSATNPNSSFYKGVTAFYKWGIYLGVAPIGADFSKTGTGAGAVTVYDATVSHP